MPPASFTYTLIRSRRKSVALIVQHDGTLLVRAPLRFAKAKIDEFVASKAAWIEKHRQIVRNAPPRPTSALHQFRAGEQFLYLGQAYPLEIGKTPHVLDFSGGKFHLDESAVAQAETIFTAWYKVQALLVIEDRVRLYAARCGFTYQRVGITSARTRWGSCSSRDSLNFTWRLVMAPLDVVDYVVVHELAHLRVRNHSPAFWKEVAAILPDFAARRKWLKANGRMLSIS